ncbi:MAG: carboxylating nicotinate-nucleotide diphosphorylase [Deltaproteobacteria bacterium]|nr:carboxylating nicotinate-nucleotide diphosphorylase [Deltaproteobacteria bacterium]
MDPLLDRLIDLALEEDLGAAGDVTTRATVPADARAEGLVRAKEPLVVAGVDALIRVFARVDPAVTVSVCERDGARVSAGAVVARVSGRAHSLLVGERPALNFLMRLSGIATQAARFAAAVHGTRARVVDTRKTTPGWRALEKAAVRAGGCANHRCGLFDGVLIKDNHIEAAGGIAAAVAGARAAAHHLLVIEVEASTQAQVEQCLALGVGAILLDNMDDAALARAVSAVRAHEQRSGARVVLEASGNMSLERLPAVAATGVDLISMGALTHQARSVDLSMKLTLAQ